MKRSDLLSEPTFFETQSDLRKWFEENHNKTNELYVDFTKS